MAQRILLTVFEPFGGSDVNASLEAGYLLAQADDRIQLVTLPVVRYAAPDRALSLLQDRVDQGDPPQFMVSLGEAGPEPVVRLEKVAINWDDYRIPDNAGNQPRDAAICPGYPDAYFATLPVATIAERLAGRTPLPVTVSLSAGAYLCNHTAYGVLDFLRQSPICPYTFIHVPSWRPTNGREPLYALVETLRLVLDTARVLTVS
ncbi:MAG: pyroglutamyl-peptidase I [Armatimonadaceae bacterium]